MFNKLLLKIPSIKFIVIALITFFTLSKINAQIVAPGGFIKGTSVEIGVDPVGGFEGATSAPAGFHSRGGSGGKFGFVANPALDGWATWNGDFFTPGTPENGWGIQIGTTQLSNNCWTGLGPSLITGSLTGYSHVLDCYNLDWAGSVTSGTNVIGAKINYFLQEFDLFYTTTVILTNNSTSTIPLMYYYRNVDPDNNQSYPGGPGSYATINKIEDQAGGVSGCQLACVSASQSPSGVMPASYMAFAAVGSEYRVSYGGFSERSGANIWNGVAPSIGTLGSVHTDDEAISLSYRIQNFLPGTSRTIKFVTILNAADKNIALANLLYLSYPGSGFFPPSSCNPVVDTVKACGGSTIIQVDGPNVNDYNWSWSPGTFLSSTTTYSTVVTPTATIVYTITGTPISTVCVSPIPLSYTIAVKPLPPLPVTISPSLTLCQNASGNLTAGGGSYYVWTGPGSYSGSGPTVTITPTSTLSSGTYSAAITNTNGCTATATVDVYVIPSPSVSVNSPTICSGQTATITATGSSLTSYTWSPGGLSGTTYTTAPVTTSTVLVTATDGTCIAQATSTISILSFSVNTATVCPGQTAILTGTGTVSSYSWNTGATTSSISVTPSSTTVYLLTGIAASCSSVLTTTVTVTPNPTITISTPTICAGNQPTFNVNVTGATGAPTVLPVGSLVSGSAPAFTVVAPIFASTGTITVTATNGVCPIVNTGTVIVIPNPTVTISSSYTFCAGNTATLTAGGATSYSWTPGGETTSSIIVTPSSTTVYSVTGTSSVGGCFSGKTGTVTVIPAAVANYTGLTSAQVFTVGNVLEVTNTSSNYTTINWTLCDGSNSTANNIVIPLTKSEDCCIKLVAKNAYCSDSITKCYKVVPEFYIVVPNVFTPNGDNTNEIFKFNNSGVKEMNVLIYDRWGLKMYEWSGLTGGWDGNAKSGPAPSGTYFYILNYTKNDDTSKSEKGFFQLFRD